MEQFPPAAQKRYLESIFERVHPSSWIEKEQVIQIDTHITAEGGEGPNEGVCAEENKYSTLP